MHSLILFCWLGRVQSVALRLIAEREAEIEAFKPKEWWSINASLSLNGQHPFEVSTCRKKRRMTGDNETQMTRPE